MTIGPAPMIRTLSMSVRFGMAQTRSNSEIKAGTSVIKHINKQSDLTVLKHFFIAALLQSVKNFV